MSSIIKTTNKHFANCKKEKFMFKDLRKRAFYLPPALPPSEYRGYVGYVMRKAAWGLIALVLAASVILIAIH